MPLDQQLRQALSHVLWIGGATDTGKTTMERRNKPSFKDKVSDPERATRNVFVRDMLLAEEMSAQAESRGLTVYEVEGTRSVEEMATLIERHFELYVGSTRIRSGPASDWTPTARGG